MRLLPHQVFATLKDKPIFRNEIRHNNSAFSDGTETKNSQMKKPTKLSEQDQEYLNTLRESEFQAIDEFDKTILALAGGAFGVSFAFLKDIVKPDVVTHKHYLIGAWICWCTTLTLNLTSFYFSHLAMRRAQRKYQDGEKEEAELGGFYHSAVMWFNPSSGVAFILGLICMSVFVTTNIDGTKPTTSTTTAVPASSTTAAAEAKQHPGSP